MQVNCDETNLGCNENVMDDNSNGDLHSSGEMDSGDETIGDVCLDNSMDTDMNDNGTSDKENEKGINRAQIKKVENSYARIVEANKTD
ncbi:hypothetical protein Tco_1494917 [Tanacetum coccineum]